MKNFTLPRNSIPEVGIHTVCPCYQKHETQTIRQKPIVAGEKGSIHATTHRIVFVMEGSIRISIQGTGDSVVIGSDEFIFLPIGIRFDYETIEDGLLMVFSIDKSIELVPECHTFRFQRDAGDNARSSTTSGGIHPLLANDRIKYFVKGVLATELDGLKCTTYARLLVGQLLFLIQVYYLQETYTRFYSALFNADVEFSDFVYNNWKKYQTAGELAAAFRLGSTQFADRFVKVFGETPGQWINNRKRAEIYHDLCSSTKSIKEVAAEYSYALPNFTRYCRTNFGSTPAAIREAVLKGTNVM